MSALLEVENLRKHYPVRRGFWGRTRGEFRALDGVSLRVEAGECVAVVGESGSGKTTLGRCVLRLVEPTAGAVRFRGEDLLALPPRELRRRRRALQMIFQDPYGSLDPRQRAGRIVAEPLEVNGLARGAVARRRAAELLELVGLPASAAARYPHEFSGGQRQRIGIARALATGPELVVADEPVSALDVSVRAQILNLLADLRQRLGLALLFIGHDLAVVEQLADRVAVLYQGRIVETGAREAVFSRPQHPYTVGLLAAVPNPDPRPRPASDRPLAGLAEMPAPIAEASLWGCRFRPRCPSARERCATEDPALRDVEPGHAVACHYPGEVAGRGARATF